MNIKRGLFRAWVLFAIIWIMGVAAAALDTWHNDPWSAIARLSSDKAPIANGRPVADSSFDLATARPVAALPSSGTSFKSNNMNPNDIRQLATSPKFLGLDQQQRYDVLMHFAPKDNNFQKLLPWQQAQALNYMVHLPRPVYRDEPNPTPLTQANLPTSPAKINYWLYGFVGFGVPGLLLGLGAVLRWVIEGFKSK